MKIDNSEVRLQDALYTLLSGIITKVYVYSIKKESRYNKKTNRNIDTYTFNVCKEWDSMGNPKGVYSSGDRSFFLSKKDCAEAWLKEQGLYDSSLL